MNRHSVPTLKNVDFRNGSIGRVSNGHIDGRSLNILNVSPNRRRIKMRFY